MVELFDSYERQYCEKSTALQKLSGLCSTLSGDEKRKKLEDLKKGLEEADALIRRMELEARSSQGTTKATLMAKLREYKTDVSNIKREMKRVSSDSADERDQLLELGMTPQSPALTDQKTRLLTNTAKLSDSNERLREGRKVLAETEELGVSILSDLHQQRQTLLHARESLHGVDDGIGRSRQILNNMAKRMSRNKWIMATAVGILLVAICLVLFAKFNGH